MSQVSRWQGYECVFFFFSSRRRHTRYIGDWSSDVCSSDLVVSIFIKGADGRERAGVSGDELSRNGLRSGVVNRSIRGSKRRRNASCLLSEQRSEERRVRESV